MPIVDWREWLPVSSSPALLFEHSFSYSCVRFESNIFTPLWAATIGVADDGEPSKMRMTQEVFVHQENILLLISDRSDLRDIWGLIEDCLFLVHGLNARFSEQGCRVSKDEFAVKSGESSSFTIEQTETVFVLSPVEEGIIQVSWWSSKVREYEVKGGDYCIPGCKILVA